MSETNKENEILYTAQKRGYTFEVRENGHYVIEGAEGKDGRGGNAIEAQMNLASNHLNQLKAQLFNLIESSVTDPEQQEAMKGLIKGFCNERYKNLVSDLNSIMFDLGFDCEPDVNFLLNSIDEN